MGFVGVMSSIRLHFPTTIHMTNAVRHAPSKKRMRWHPWCWPANLLPLFLATLINLFLFTSFVFYGEIKECPSDIQFRLLILSYRLLSSYCVCCEISKDQYLVKLWAYGGTFRARSCPAAAAAAVESTNVHFKSLIPDMTTLPDKTPRRFKVMFVTTLNQFFDEDKS